MYARISLSMYVCVWYFHKIFIKIFNYLRIKNLENVCLFFSQNDLLGLFV